MKKIVFVYPGVGSQYTGMGKSLLDNFKIYKETLEEASDILKMNVTEMYVSPEKSKELNTLENAQCCLFVASIATYRVFKQEIGIKPACCMGHSLGEYSALCSADAIQFKDALELVKHRGLVVQEVSKGLNGTMMWVVNLDSQIVGEVCQEFSSEGQEVYVSAFDSPNQSSISGHVSPLMKAARELEKRGAIVYPLKFSGPFHCPLMKEASEQMKDILKNYDYHEPSFPVISNQNALPYNGAPSIVSNLSKQLVSPIRWQDSIDYLLKQEITTAIEMGPKNVLKFLMKKNTDSIFTYTTDKIEDIHTIKEELIITEDEYTTFIGRCLGIAVSTKNRNNSNEEYEEYIVKPYRKMESIFQECQATKRIPKKSDLKISIDYLQIILKSKQVPEEEQTYWLNSLFGGKILSGEGDSWGGV
jgi:[acyl-carrier-protein] S-malonyltransferase